MTPRVQNHKRQTSLLYGWGLSWLAFSSLPTFIWASTPGLVLPTHPPPDGAGATPTPSGPIDDTQCNIEQLEQANDSQLYEILQELVLRTEFFQHFAVDLEQTCPLSASSSGNNNKDSGEHESAEEEFVCTGGTDEEDGFSLAGDDEPHEPACSVDTSSSGSTTSSDPFTSSSPAPQSQALQDLFEQGFASKDQAGAFQWKQQTDLVQKKTPASSPASSRALQETMSTEDCETLDADHHHHNGHSHQAHWLPESFWMDMCSHVNRAQTKLVNLALNPERNTGYNGTHLWHAIYQENCIGNLPVVKSTSTTEAAATSKDTQWDPSQPPPPPQVEPQCFEERVLYRLLSGLHTSTTLSIAKHYYMPSKRKNRVNWEPNPQYFMDHFQDHPEYIRNLHFSYVVLLRALKKAAPFLYKYEIQTGNIVQDEAATILLKRLLDSSILQSCSSVFGAFDETLMFRQQTTTSSSDSDATAGVESIALQQSFKGVFHNISSILDCVQCQQCKLHGKMAMLGYGTALKILFIKPSALQLERNEIVAFINTVAKLSQSIREVRELTHLYWIQEQQKQVRGDTTAESDPPTQWPGMASSWDSWNSVDGAVGAVAALQKEGLITPEQEAALVLTAMDKTDPALLILAKHYFSGDANTDLIKLRDMLAAKGLLEGSTAIGRGVDPLDNPDAIVVGSGLAGLAATLEILDRGGYVVLLEKEHLLGGNSNKASSGINACCPNSTFAASALDSQEVFLNDTIRSAGEAARPDLIEVLVSNSARAVEWLQSRAGVDLSLKAQLGGHSSKRTHRPSNGMAGAEIIYGMQKAVRKYEKTGHLRVLVDTKVTKLLTRSATEAEMMETNKTISDNIVIGVEIESVKAPGAPQTLKAPFVIMATGGFASDRRPTESYLSQYRPELLQFPTTAGAFSTGDGIALATTLGADTTSMDQVQIHPTGWVDPTDPDNPSKTLAAELMRGVGGILLNDKGQRFANELGTRAYVTDKMLSHNWRYYMTKTWDASAEIPTFALILSSAAAEDAGKHVDLYSHKGLLKRLKGIDALAEWAGLPVKTMQASIEKYRLDGEKGIDHFGKKEFRGMFAEDLSKEVFYAGRVVPVLHYCMGGITIDAEGQVLDTSKRAIQGLRAAGEVTGGVHGNNRLAGNSLLECTVFGSLVGRNLPLMERAPASAHVRSATLPTTSTTTATKKDRPVPASELALHNTDDDCWVAIHGVVYDLTAFAEEHPAGPESILELAGRDGTEAFRAVHNENILEDFDDDRIGILVVDTDADDSADVSSKQTVSNNASTDAQDDDDEEEDEEDCTKCQVEGVDAPLFA